MMDFDRYAADWIEDWNSHEIDRILSHYAENACFRSPMAEKRTGYGLVTGLDNLRAYWSPVFSLRPNLWFTLDRVFHGFETLALSYHDELDRSVIETLTFDKHGKVIFGSGCYAQ